MKKEEDTMELMEEKLIFHAEAIERRYGDLSDDIDRENMFFVGAKNQKTLVDVVGFDQVKKDWMQLKNLRKISLELMHVTGTNVDNDAQSLNTIIPNVRDLDLSRNLLRYWSDVTRIVFQLKKLQVLNISGNRLADLTDTTENPSLFESLETIFINRMSMTWNQIINLSSGLPNLTSVHACFNGIERLENPRYGKVLTSIQLLNLEGNKLDWHEIEKLSTLENLETLIINNNRISKIHVRKRDGIIGFQSLKAISLSYNEISEWLSINELGHLTSLNTIKFKANPLCKGESPIDIRYELIARLKQVKIINGSEVTVRERKDAELLYLKKYSSAWRDSGGNEELVNAKLSNEFEENHPRFIELIKIYGPPITSVKKATRLKDNLISLHFKCVTLDESKTAIKKVPVTMTIQQLKNLIQRMFKVKAFDQRLSFHDSKTKKDVELDDSLKDLLFYSISSGDVVSIRCDG